MEYVATRDLPYDRTLKKKLAPKPTTCGGGLNTLKLHDNCARSKGTKEWEQRHLKTFSRASTFWIRATYQRCMRQLLNDQ